jgi:ribosomal-protein-alanine acetyltransferase
LTCFPAGSFRPDVVVAHALRRARRVDAGTLAAIDASVNISPWTEAQFATACAAGGAEQAWALVVEEDGRIDGYVVVSRVLDEASIHSIAVDPTQQRKGLGQSLLHAALVRAQGEGTTRCLLEVRQANTAARRLYTENGFVLDGVRKNYYPGGEGREDALLMSKELKGTANECA